MKLDVAKKVACCAACVPLACTVVPAGIACADEAAAVSETAAELSEDAKAAQELIEPLATLDPFAVSEDDVERVETAEGKYNDLPVEQQRLLDARDEKENLLFACPGSKQSYARVLESAVWSLGLLEEVDNSTNLPDGTYSSQFIPALEDGEDGAAETIPTAQVISRSDRGMYYVSRPRSWSATDVEVRGGKAYATLMCNESGKYSKLKTGAGVWDEPELREDDEQVEHTAFTGVPIDLNATFSIAVMSSTTFSSGSTAGSVVYKLTTETPLEKTADKAVKAKPALSSVAKGKKAFTAKWKKKSGVTGYQLQYATNKKFTSGKKTVKIKGAAKTSKKVSKLKAKKTYYVRVRSYTKVGPGTCYSSWTSAKKVTTKK